MSSVRIIDHPMYPAATIASAARMSTTTGDAITIFSKSMDYFDEKNTNLIKKVIASGHVSILEHCNITVAFNDVSILFEQWLIEHRLASFTVKSRRYVDFSKMNYILPGSYSDSSDLENMYAIAMRTCKYTYQYFIENGVPNEDARFVLPYSTHSNLYCTMNLREVIYVIYCLLGEKIPEFKELGDDLLVELSNLIPGVFCTDCEREDLKKYLGSIQYPEYAPNGFNDLSNAFEYAAINIGLNNNSSSPNVKLVDFDEDYEQKIVKAALMKYYFASYDTANTTAEDDKIQDMVIDIIMKNSHPRELEMANFTFHIDHISLAGLTHLTRHRIQSMTHLPLHLASHSNYILPETITKNEEFKSKYIECFKTMEALREETFKYLMPEEAGYLMLAGCSVPVTFMMNARELLHFISLRSCNRAQWEIRSIAIDMLNFLRSTGKRLFYYYGPSCYVNSRICGGRICPEGERSCGNCTAVCNKFDHQFVGNEKPIYNTI